MANPLGVTRQMPELEEDAGAGNTVTENLEFTKKIPGRERVLEVQEGG